MVSGVADDVEFPEEGAEATPESLSNRRLLGSLSNGCIWKFLKSSIHNCRSFEDAAAAANAVSTLELRIRRLEEDDGALVVVDTNARYFDFPSLLTSFGLNSIAEGPDKPTRVQQAIDR